MDKSLIHCTSPADRRSAAASVSVKSVIPSKTALYDCRRDDFEPVGETRAVGSGRCLSYI